MIARVLPRSLRARLVTLVAAVGAVLLLTTGLVSTALLTRQFDAAVDQGLVDRADDLAGQWRPGSTITLADPFAQILADNGEVLAHSAGAPTTAIIDPALLPGLPKAGTRIDTAVPELRGPARLLARPSHGVVLVVAAPLESFDSARARLQRLALGFVFGLVLALLIGTWAIVSASLRPVGRMTVAADRLQASPTTLGELPVPASGDELTRLARTLNRLLAALAGVIARERALVDDASHEIRTPLSVVRGELELALDEPDPTRLREGVERALVEVTRLGVLADDLLLLARETSGPTRPLTPVRLVPWLRRAVSGVLPPVVTVDVTADERVCGALINADETALTRAVANILRNAGAAGARRVEIAVSVEDGMVTARFADDGTGFPADTVEHAFERFFRAEASRPHVELFAGSSGAGLGLAIVQAIVEAHGGAVSASNSDQASGGAVIELRFPSVPDPLLA